MKFVSEDNGNCRVYYRDGRKLYCWQDESSWGRQVWKYYECSRDGEPSHHATIPNFTPLPPGETAVGRDLFAFLSAWQTKQHTIK
jgi:hypothetical protein